MKSPAENLIESLKTSETLLDLLSVESADEAGHRIYIDGLDKDSDLAELVPYVIIRSDTNRKWSRISTGNSDQYDESGSLRLIFEVGYDETHTSLTISGQLSQLQNTCDSIISDILALSSQGGYLSISEASRIEAYIDDEIKDPILLHVEYAIDWR